MSVLKIENFPNDLHKRLKRLALDSDETLREVIIRGALAEADRMEAAQAKGGE